MYLRIRKVRYRTATQVGCSPQARHKVNSSMLSVNCEKAEKATQRYPDCRSPYFAAVAGLWSAPGYPRERGDSQEGGNRGCLPSCASARRQRRFRSLRKRPMSTIIKIDKYPQKGYTNLTRGYGGIGRRARFRFWCPRRAGSSPVTRTNKKRCGISPQRFSFAYFYLDSLLCAFCSKRSFATIAR